MLSIGTAALRLVLVELVRSLSMWSGRVVLVNGHGGNREAVTLAGEQLRTEDHDVACVGCSTEGDAHAGRAETSLLLHLAPWLVRPQHAQAGNTRPLGELMTELMAGGMRSVSPNGVLGDPTGATAGDGAALFDQIVEAVRRGL